MSHWEITYMDLVVKEGSIPNEQRESCKHLLSAVSHEYKLGLGGAQLALLLSLVWIKEGCLTLNS